jgi:hypothetical protein
VLPPKCPQMNGAVDATPLGANAFYSVCELPRNVDDLNPIRDSFQQGKVIGRVYSAIGTRSSSTS